MNIVYRFPSLHKLWSDKSYLAIIYFLTFRKKLNLRNPKTFNEKLQWLKLYDRKSIYTTMVDKFSVKEYVSKIVGSEYIIPTLGVWNSFDEIEFKKLPDKFVLKCTHDSGGVIICNNKLQLNIPKSRNKIMNSLKRNYFYLGGEWPYKNVIPRVIAEKYLIEEGNTSIIDQEGIIDYKFFCFNGEPKFLYISQGLDNHATAQMDYLTLDWKRAPFYRKDYNKFKTIPPKPESFDKMLVLCSKLSKGIPFVRVDLYYIQGNIYFSELTFTPVSGLSKFYPEEWNYTIGDWIKLV